MRKAALVTCVLSCFRFTVSSSASAVETLSQWDTLISCLDISIYRTGVPERGVTQRRDTQAVRSGIRLNCAMSPYAYSTVLAQHRILSPTHLCCDTRPPTDGLDTVSASQSVTSGGVSDVSYFFDLIDMESCCHTSTTYKGFQDLIEVSVPRKEPRQKRQQPFV